jgi:photosynthetic reaction center cytochrome c subunit
MNLGLRGTIVGAMRTAVVCLFAIALANGQTGPEQKPLMAEQVFKNVQVLRGIPVDQFLETMGFFSASLNANCVDCHVEESGGNWERYADDSPKKQTARKMIVMMRAINQSYFGGRRVLTCYSCHRNGDRPKVIPSLAEVYGVPPADEPDEIPEQDPKAPSADQVLDKYIQALGGTQRLASLTSFVAKGTYQGYGEGEKSPVEVFAKAPGQRATIIHKLTGDNITTYNGRNAWVAKPETDAPVPMLALTGGNLDGARLEADLSFPAGVKQALIKWRAGLASIDDREVQVVQGTNAGGSVVKLYFDRQSGLLLRLVRYTESSLGLNPTQIDYADYRDVAGVKMPFRWTVTWVDGRSTFELSDVQPNVPIDAAKFAKPSPPISPPQPAAP